jgi:hypothetical protein
MAPVIISAATIAYTTAGLNALHLVIVTSSGEPVAGKRR